MILERDTLLHKRYRIQGNLGQGGMGSVYHAIDENLGMTVAVKENLFTTDEYARQFRLEAVILANIRHPNLPRVSDHFVIAGEGQYLVMDFIDGEDLRQRMERVGVLPEEEVIHIGAAICDALSYLHARRPSILHRDIKPGNVKIAPDGHIFLVDFGLAKVVQGNQATTTGARAMTPGYSPPEQYGTARTDSRTDIYSLGATLYAALTGVIPEDGLARAMDNAQLTPVRKRNPDVSRRLSAVIEKAMEVDPGDRYQTAEEFKLALLNSKSKTQQILGTYTVSPPPSAEDRKSDPEKTEMALVQSTPPEEYSFVSPRKKQMERNRRTSRFLIGGLSALLIVGFISLVFFFPSLLPAAVQKSLPFIPPVIDETQAAVTPLPIASATQPPTVIVVTATPNISPVETQTAVDPSVVGTPIGGDFLQIAYSSLRTGVAQIYLTDLLSDKATPVTNMPGGACQASWAPDGQRLVFISPCNIKKDSYPQSSLYIVNVDGSDPQIIQSGIGGDFEPAWSPDGKYIAFTSLRDGYMQIYSYNVLNQQVTRLIETPRNQYARQPSWSPDGERIVYAFKRIDTYEIWTMTFDGKDQKQLLPSGNKFSNYQPVWSPDGKMVLYSQQSATEFTFPNLFSVSVEGEKKPLEIFLGVLSIEDVKFSPNDIWIAYESGSQHAYHVYYSTLSGANQARITEEITFDDFDPAWRPVPKTP